MKSRILPTLKMFRGPHIFTGSKYECFIEISWKCRCMKIKMLLQINCTIGRSNILRSIFTIFCALWFSHDYFCKHVVKMEKLENRIEYFFFRKNEPELCNLQFGPTWADDCNFFRHFWWRIWNTIVESLKWNRAWSWWSGFSSVQYPYPLSSQIGQINPIR